MKHTDTLHMPQPETPTSSSLTREQTHQLHKETAREHAGTKRRLTLRPLSPRYWSREGCSCPRRDGPRPEGPARFSFRLTKANRTCPGAQGAWTCRLRGCRRHPELCVWTLAWTLGPGPWVCVGELPSDCQTWEDSEGGRESDPAPLPPFPFILHVT